MMFSNVFCLANRPESQGIQLNEKEKEQILAFKKLEMLGFLLKKLLTDQNSCRFIFCRSTNRQAALVVFVCICKCDTDCQVLNVNFFIIRPCQ